jgi:cell division protein FtsZ
MVLPFSSAFTCLGSSTTPAPSTQGHVTTSNSKLQQQFTSRVRLWSSLDNGLESPFGGTNGEIPASGIPDPTPPCVIKVIGVGGGGGNAVNRMIETRIEGVSFWAINTDAQALSKSLAPNVLNIGRALTRGLGAGGDPAVGKKAAMENLKELDRICKGADMVFITAGMGGGTGSGCAPVLAEIAKRDNGCLTVGVVTKPFAFEGRKRMRQAEEAIAELRKHVDTVIVVSNDKLLRIVPDNTPVTDAFLVADDILRQGVVGISEIILKTGLVNVDFADVRAVMKDAGTALMGVGTGVGRNRAADAAIAAISSPLLDFPIQKSKRIVFNIVGGADMGLQEINEASEVIYENADDNANIIFGALVDEAMGEEISITVLACDFEDLSAPEEAGQSQAEPAAPTTSLVRNPNFYKERRQNTKSPLGPDASLEETRVAMTRGFKKPVDPSNRDETDEKRRKGWGFLRRFSRRKD